MYLAVHSLDGRASGTDGGLVQGTSVILQSHFVTFLMATNQLMIQLAKLLEDHGTRRAVDTILERLSRMIYPENDILYILLLCCMDDDLLYQILRCAQDLDIKQ